MGTNQDKHVATEIRQNRPLILGELAMNDVQQRAFDALMAQANQPQTEQDHPLFIQAKARKSAAAIALSIVDPGASNARGVALAIHQMICDLRDKVNDPAHEDAVKLAVHQLYSLTFGECLCHDCIRAFENALANCRHWAR